MTIIRQRKGAATRDALMNAGFRMFAEKGYLRTQIGDIVRTAGKSNGVFHIYFKNKDALLDAWLDESDETVPWYQADTDLLFEKARHFVLLSFWGLYERFGPIFEALDAAALVNDHFAQRRAEILGKGDASTARMIRHAQAQGRWLGIDPEVTAISIAAMITQTVAYWFRHRAELEARGFDKDAAIAHLEALYTRMLESGRAVVNSESTMPNAVGGSR